MKPLTPFAALAALALVSIATSPTRAASTTKPAVPPAPATAEVTAKAAPILPNLPENQAEIEALRRSGIPNVAPAAPVVRGARSAFLLEIEGLLASEAKQLEALRTRMAAEKDAEAAMAIQREIERVKGDTEIAMLSAQAANARRQGREKLATEIDAVIAAMRQPPQFLEPAPRPATETAR